MKSQITRITDVFAISRNLTNPYQENFSARKIELRLYFNHLSGNTAAKLPHLIITKIAAGALVLNMSSKVVSVKRLMLKFRVEYCPIMKEANAATCFQEVSFTPRFFRPIFCFRCFFLLTRIQRKILCAFNC